MTERSSGRRPGRAAAHRRASLVLFLVATLACLACDQMVKEVARTQLVPGASTRLAFGTVELLLVENSGGFLSLGEALPELARRIAFQGLAPLALVVLCVVLLRRSRGSRLEVLGLALVAGGGIGNWLDRLLREGLVTDFVRLLLGPVHTGIFNVADVAIVLGAALLALSAGRASDSGPEADGA